MIRLLQTIMARLLGKRADARLKARSIGGSVSTTGYPGVTVAGSIDRDATRRIGKIARIKRRIVETMKTLASPRKTKGSSEPAGETRISKILCFVANDRRVVNSFDVDPSTKLQSQAVFDESSVTEKGFPSQRRVAEAREQPQWEQLRDDGHFESVRDKIVIDEPDSAMPLEDDDRDDEEDVVRSTVDERPSDDWPFIEFVERIYRGKSFRVRKKFDIGERMRKIERLCGSPKFRSDKGLSGSGASDCCVNQSVPLVSPDTPDTPTDNPEPRLPISDLDVLLRES